MIAWLSNNNKKIEQKSNNTNVLLNSVAAVFFSWEDVQNFQAKFSRQMSL